MSSKHHHIEYINNVAVYRLKGKLMGGDETAEIHAGIKQIFADGYRFVVIDVGDVTWMNSTGIGALVACLQEAKTVDAKIVLARVVNKITELLVISRLDKFFETYNTVEEALTVFH